MAASMEKIESLMNDPEEREWFVESGRDMELEVYGPYNNYGAAGIRAYGEWCHYSAAERRTCSITIGYYDEFGEFFGVDDFADRKRSESITAVDVEAPIVAIHETPAGSIIAVQRETSLEGSVTEEVRIMTPEMMETVDGWDEVPAPEGADYKSVHIRTLEDYDESIASVVVDYGDEVYQTVYANPGDVEKIRAGADVTEWEDGCGHTVCRANACRYIGMQDRMSKTDLETLVRSSDITGGITDPDGDEIQLKDFDGTPYSVLLSVSLGDRQPSDDELIACAKAIYAGWTVDVEGWEEPTLYAVRWTDREDEDREESYLSMEDARKRAEQVGRRYKAVYGRLWNDGDLTDGGEVVPEPVEILDEAKGVICVTSSGSSLALNVTRLLKSIGAKRGDYVEVTVRKI